MAFLVLLFTLLFGVAEAAPAKTAAPKLGAVTLTTADAVTLAGWGGVPSKAQNGVVFLPQLGGGKEDFRSIQELFFRQGVAVVAIDFRKLGANAIEGTTAEAADYLAMPKDVAAATAWLRAAGVQKVALVGASIGANLALRAAADDANIASVTLLSPGIDYKGLTTRDAILRYGARPILIVVSSDDPYSATSASVLEKAASGVKELLLYTTAGHGVKMFNQEPTLESTIVTFVSRNWTPTAPTSSTPEAKKIGVTVQPIGTQTK